LRGEELSLTALAFFQLGNPSLNYNCHFSGTLLNWLWFKLSLAASRNSISLPLYDPDLCVQLPGPFLHTSI